MTRMKALWAIGLLAALGVADAGESVVHCVDPADESCFPRIQNAIDAAQPGDVVEVRPHPTGSYRESVTVDKANLVLRGSVPVFVEERSPDTLAALDWPAERAACSPVRLDVCGTQDVSIGCGFDADEGLGQLRSGIVIAAADVSVTDLTLRHGFTGIRALPGTDGVTIERNCFVRNGAAIIVGQNDEDDEIPSATVDGATIAFNRIFAINGDSDHFAIDVFGNAVEMRGNLLANADGIRVQGGTTGNSTFVANAVVGTEDNAGIRVRDGAGHRVEANYFFGIEDDGIRFADLVSSSIVDNLVVDVPDDDGSIRTDDVVDVTIEGNRLLGSSNPAIELSDTVDSLVRNNVIQTVGGDSSEGCIDFESGTLRTVASGNQLQLCKHGIDFSGSRPNVQSNVLRSNLVEFPIRAGIAVRTQQDARIRDNVIVGASATGIRQLDDGNGSRITGNTISGGRQDVCNDGTISEFTDNSFETGGPEVSCADR